MTDSLFRYVGRGVLGRTPARHEKPDAPAELQQRGVCLIDLSEDPLNGVDLVACVPGLVERCRALSPGKIILIKANVFDLAYGALDRAGLPVGPVRVPFPGSGRQRQFEEEFARALEAG